MRRFSFVALVLAVCVSLSAHGAVPSVTGIGDWAGKVREYYNPFDPTGDHTAKETSIWYTDGWSIGGASPLAQIVNRIDGQDVSNGGGRLFKSGGGGETVWMTFQAPEPFVAGTIITSQNIWGGFPGGTSMPSTFKLGNGGATANWNSLAAVPELIVPGTLGWGTIQIAHPGGVYDSFRLDITAVSHSDGRGYADYNTVIILPDQLERIDTVTVVSNPNVTWSHHNNLLSMTNNNGCGYQEDGRVAKGDVTFTFTFDDVQQIDALVLWSYENRAANFTLKYMDDNGNLVPLADIAMPMDPKGWALPVQLDEPLYTTTVVMDFGFCTLQDINFREVMFFTKVPEPATMTLLALGGLALLRRRKA